MKYIIPAMVLLAGCSFFRDTELERSDDVGVSNADVGSFPDAGGAADAQNPDQGDNENSLALDMGPGGTDVGTRNSETPDGGMQPADGPCAPATTAADTSGDGQVVGTGAPESCTQEALQSALDAGGVVTFNCGGPAVIRVTSPLTVSREVVLDGGGEISLSGGNAAQIMRIEFDPNASRPDIAIQNITFRDGSASSESDTGCGAALYRSGGTVSLTSVAFVNNSCATGNGGAIHSEGSHPLRMTGATFTGNSAEYGGAISTFITNVVMTNSTFSGNSATVDGGGLHGAIGKLDLCGTTFRNNSAGHWGGAFMFTFGGTDPEDELVVDRSVFAENTADEAAGVAYISGERPVTIHNTVAVDNEAGAVGAWWIQRATLDLQNITVARNTATAGQNGGMTIDSTTGTMKHATFVENETLAALTFNGALSGSGEVTISNSIFSDNYGANIYSPQTCAATHPGKGGNLQFPRDRDDGQPDLPCTDDIIFADPLLESEGGMTYVPGTDSPAIGLGVDCAPEDINGTARPAQGCTAGAVEVP